MYGTIDLADFDAAELKEGCLFFYVGAGMSQAAGLVGWFDLIDKIHRYRVAYEEFKGPPPVFDEADTNSQYLQDFVSKLDAEAFPILSRESTDRLTFGRTVLLNLLLRFHRRTNRAVNAFDLNRQSALWSCKPQGILTTNYDTFLERACPSILDSEVRTYRYTAKFLRFLFSNPSFILKLHGDVNDLGSMVFDPAEAWGGGGQFSGLVGEDLRQVYRQMVCRGHVVYVGTGLRDRTVFELESSLVGAKNALSCGRVALLPENELAPKSPVHDHLQAGLFSDVTFVTYDQGKVDPSDACLTFLRTIDTVRVHATPPRPRCAEAIDIWKNLVSDPPFKRHHCWQTAPWTLDSGDVESPQ